MRTHVLYIQNILQKVFFFLLQYPEDSVRSPFKINRIHPQSPLAPKANPDYRGEGRILSHTLC